MLLSSLSVRVLLYSPRRTLVDIAEVFLWLMAVGTILSASFWSAWTAKEAAQEHYRRLKARSTNKWFIAVFISLKNGIIQLTLAQSLRLTAGTARNSTGIYADGSSWGSGERD